MSQFQPWRAFQPDAAGEPHGWIQWKGTNVCLDFRCRCGASSHVDGEGAYRVRCPQCGRIYELAGFVEVRELSDTDAAAAEPITPLQAGAPGH